MKKISLRALLIFVAFTMASAAGNMSGILDDTYGIITMVGTVLILASVSLFVLLPAGLGFMSYSHFKKKSEQSQEDNTMKSALTTTFAAIFGVAAAYLIVGYVGMYGFNKTSLSDGNKAIVGSILAPSGSKISTGITAQ